MGWIAGVIVGVVILFIIFTVLSGIRIVRPTHRGLVERLGKYNRYANPGIHLTIPYGIERMYQVDIREVLVEAQPQTIITNDNLNAKVDAQVYLKVKADEENVKASIYNVTNYELQIVNLSRTTLRNIIGTMTLKSANSERGKINEELRGTLKSETASWGIEILRTELKEIDPPPDVQETMNKVVKAENEKIAAIDFATATETQADGARRAEIKKAEGIRQAKILEAAGRGAGHPARQRGGRQVLRGQRPDAAQARGRRAGALPEQQGRRARRHAARQRHRRPRRAGADGDRRQGRQVEPVRRPSGRYAVGLRGARFFDLGRQRGAWRAPGKPRSSAAVVEHDLGHAGVLAHGPAGMGSNGRAPGRASRAARSSSFRRTKRLSWWMPANMLPPQKKHG